MDLHFLNVQQIKSSGHERSPVREHWFSFGDSCLAISERAPPLPPEAQRRHVLFFLHGRYGHAEMWSPLVERLANQFHCLHLDLPGFGRSFSVRGRGFSILEQAQIVRSLIRRFLTRGKKAILIGHDIGGAVAELCTLNEPAVFSGLVLINSKSVIQAPKDLRTGFRCLQARRMLKSLLRSGSRKMPQHEMDSLVKAWENRLRRIAMAQAFQTWEYTWPGPFERHSWLEKLRALPHPVLLLWGRRDTLNPPESAEELMRFLPEAYLFENEEAGHWPCLEATEWVDEKMREYLFRLDSVGWSGRRA